MSCTLRRDAPARLSLLALLLAIAVTIQPSTAHAQAGTVGQWSSTSTNLFYYPECATQYSWPGEGAVHATLLRDGSNNARVVYVSRNWSAGLFLYDPAQGVNSAHYRLPGHGHETFCAGHTVLSDGRLFVAGGNGPSYFTGALNSTVFDINNAAQCAYTGWTQKAQMNYGRWYPTVTALGDGKALVTSGNRFANVVVFGGRVGGSVSNDLRVVGQGSPSLANSGPSPSGSGPAAREGHCSVFTGSINVGEWEQRTIILGGKDASGALLPMTVYALARDDRNVANPYSWLTISTTGGPPPGRTNAAVTYDPSNNGALYIHGGLDGSGQPLSDLWRLAFGFPGSTSGTWTQLASSSVALHGHTINYDVAFNRLVVFGGSDGTNLSSTVYTYSIPGGTWSTPTTSGTPPSVRMEHAAAIAPGSSLNSDDVMYVHGGRQGSTYYNDLYTLQLNTLTWGPFSPAPTTLAPARASHQMILDEHDYNRLLILGGENASGALSDAWAFSFDPYIWPPEVRKNWVEWPVSPTLAGRTEHTMVYDPRATLVPIPEIYDPVANSWTALNSFARWQPMYPRMFVLPNGELFYSGPDTDTRKLNLSTGWAGSSIASTELGLSAVMYAPGKIMKCGGHYGRTEIISFDASGNTSGWQWNSANDLSGMGTRTHFNLTILPTGQVLMTNGTANHNFDSTPVKTPYIWTPPTGSGTGTWSAALVDETESRGYHSTALLLPDARIFSAGGFVGPNPNLNTARIFSPPYLFVPGTDTPATRPEIGTAPANVGYQANQNHFDVCMTSSVASVQKVCLIRAGSVTHAFNTDQRYVPLAFTTCGTHLRVATPANANEAPPGDYMLFVVDNAGVPSVAKWVRVSTQAGTPGCDDCPPDAPPLSALSRCTSIQLDWTAPGDDGLTGPAVMYDLRRSASPITNETQFAAAQGIAIPAPQAPGTPEQYIDNVGSCSPTYYYRIKAKDEAGNWSAMSNATNGKSACIAPPRQCMDLESTDLGLEMSARAPTRRGEGVEVAFFIPAHCEGEALELSVFDLTGRRVAMLERGTATPGSYQRTWSPAKGGAAGVYFARLNCGDKSLTRRLVVTP